MIGSKKQKLDFNELQNVSQFLSNSNQNDQVSNNHDMDGIIICDGDTLVRDDGAYDGIYYIWHGSYDIFLGALNKFALYDFIKKIMFHFFCFK